MTKAEESRISRRHIIAAAAGGAGALLLLASGKQAKAMAPTGTVGLFDTNFEFINPATEDTLKLIKTKTDNLDALFSSSVGRRLRNVGDTAYIDPRDRNWTITETVSVSGSLGRTWTITETVPISHANLDVALSTLAKSSQIPSALVVGRLDVNVGATVNPSNLDVALSTLAKESGGNLATLTAKDFATQTTLALIKLKTDNLDAALSTLATAAGQSATQPRNISQIAGTLLTGRDWSTDFSKLDVLLSTRLKIADYVITQELGRVGLILTAGGAIIDPRDVSDRAARLLGVVYGSQAQQLKQTATNFNLASELITGVTLYDARQIRTLTSTDVVDASDRAARLLGIVYGSQSAQLLQRAVSFDLQVQLRTAAAEYDARQIRTLTSTDVVTAAQTVYASFKNLSQIRNAADSALIDPLAETTFTARINTQGQKTMAASTPVVLASDQAAVPTDQKGTTRTMLFASIDTATSGDNTIVAADVSNKIKVAQYALVCDGTVAVRWKSGAATNLTGAMSFVANTGIATPMALPGWLMETAVNAGLVLNLSAAIGVRGHLAYFKEAS